MDDHLTILRPQQEASPEFSTIFTPSVTKCDSAVVPQELQNMVIDGIAQSLRTLRAASLVNKAWNIHTKKHLFARIVVHAITRHYGNNNPGIDRVPTPELPIITFKDAVAAIPHYFDTILRTLVLRASPLHVRMESITTGARLIKADICAHDVRSFLERFPKLNSLVIEDATWVECPGARPHKCNCMETVGKRAYKTLAFRRITHERGTEEDVTVITQSATSIDKLIIENASHLETLDPAYDIGPLNTFTLGISSEAWHHTLLIPDFPPHTLVTLNITEMSYEDMPIVQPIIEDQARTLRNISLQPRRFRDVHGTQWDALGLDGCETLKSIEVCIPVDFGSMVRVHARQAMLSHVVAQLPNTVRDISIVFNIENISFARSSCLLSRKHWTDLITACRNLPDFTMLKIHVCRPPNTIPILEGLKNELDDDLNEICSVPEGMQVPFKITYGVRSPWTIDFDLYEPDEYEEAFDEALEAADELDLEEN